MIGKIHKYFPIHAKISFHRNCYRSYRILRLTRTPLHEGKCKRAVVTCRNCEIRPLEVGPSYLW